jgi:predicted metal-dependent peptidase
MYDEKTQQELANEILSISNIGKVFVGDVDTRVHQFYEIKKASDLRPPKGGGGTCFKEAFSLALKKGADIVVYLTDTDGSFPSKNDVGKFAHLTIWVTFNESREIKSKIPFGKHVNITK